MIFDIIIDALLFGASGYITNKYVLNMLFKEYTISKKLKIGGKVKTSKKQYIKNVSTMMEKDILNSEKISDKFKDHNFNEEFTNFSKEFFDVFICRNMRSLRLKDIPVFHDACYGLKDITINLINTNTSDILNNIGSNINLSELITQKNAEHISKNLLENLLLTIKNTDVIKDISLENFESFRNVKLNDIITKNISEVIKDNIKKKANNFSTIIKENFSERIDSSINEILNQNKLDEILRHIQNEILRKPLKFYTNIDIQDIAITVRENVLEFLNSEKGEKSISDMYYDLKSYIIDNNISLLNIFLSDYENSIKKLVNSRLNNIAYSILKWIGNNNIDLDNTIKESIGEVITGHPELKSKIFSTIKTYFDSKKNNDGRIVNILLDSDVNSENLDKISSFITAEISNYLRAKDAREIINAFEDKKIFNAEILINLIKKYIKNTDNKSIIAFLNDILSMPINNFINIDLIKLFNDKLKYIFIDYIKQNTYYSSELHSDISKKLSEHIFKGFNEKIGDILDKEYIQDKSNKVRKTLIKSIEENENYIIETIKSKINDFTQQNNLSSFFNKLNDNQSADLIVAEKINELIQQNFLKLVDDIGDVRISKLLNKMSLIPNIHSSLSDFMKNIVGESIAYVSEGYISETVETHFEKLNDQEFAWHIKNSNSINTNKINITGGVIGVAAALPLSFISNKLFSSSVVSTLFSWQGLALGSVIGLSTNILAMSSFSKFRDANSILAKIPILKNFRKKSIANTQLIFADYMANIIKNNLIDENTIQDLVQSKSSQLKNNIGNTISNDEYKYLYDFFENNKDYLSGKLSDFAKGILTNNTEDISEYISKSIADMPIKMVISRKLIDSVMTAVSSNKNKCLDVSFDYIKNNIFENLKLLDLAPNKMLDQLMDETEFVINEDFNKITDFLKDTEALQKYLSKHEHSYREFLDKSLINTLSPNTLDDLCYSLFNSLYIHLFTDDNLSIMSEKTYQSLNNGFVKNIKLDNQFDRRIKFILSSMFFKYFNELVVDLHQHISSNRHVTIDTTIRENLLANLNLKEKLSYNAVGADNAITNIINILIQVKIPQFVERNLEQFYEISKGITEDLLDVYLEELIIDIDKAKVDTYVKELFVAKRRNSIIKNKSFLLFNTYIKKYDDIKLYEFAKHLHLGSINEIFANYENEISFVLKQLSSNIKRNKDSILKTSSGIFEQVSTKILDKILVKDLFNGVNEFDMIEMNNFFIKIIEDNDLLYLNISAFINSFYNYLDDRDLLDSIVDINDINMALSKTLKKLSNDNKFYNYSKELCSKIISNDLKFSAYINLSYNVKQYFIEILSDAFYLAIKQNLSKIYSSISLNEITREEIMKLSLQQYQEIYTIFWKNNYRNTIWTGLAGGIFGVNKFTGLLAVALALFYKTIKALKNAAKHIKKSIRDFTLKFKEKFKPNKDDK
jgi:hypothetical protein